ncbi:hypothetical protein C2R22_24500 (plasmid) [Salinigranum rubrum]|uniref:Uncharacterized protein n=1 Tax=Salinigranum rubrum TaxID=755307 RepID=A0A2I8VS14_9EURY|nr:hypothetical protein [Salinigranum rubrum]AUV84692.1 hypothetical protein C2R22_24500 [Salinigranum rubrum]
MTSISRREYLHRVATPTGLSAGLVVGATSVAAAVSAVADDTPSHVTREYDAELLDQYKPYLVTRDLGSNTPNALYGYVARSPEFDYTMCVYWASYDFQRGVALGYDSHFGDHEPVYVRVDEETDSLIDVSYSAYHWLRGWSATPPVDANSGSHPLLHVVDPWHHYYQTVESGVSVDLKHLDDATLEAWFDNGWNEAIHVRSLSVPWVMAGADGRSDWWRDSVSAFSYEASLRRYVYPLLYGADENLDIDPGDGGMGE